MPNLFTNEQLALFMVMLDSDNENVRDLYEELTTATKLIHANEIEMIRIRLDTQSEIKKDMAKHAVNNLKRTAILGEKIRMDAGTSFFGGRTQHGYGQEIKEMADEAEHMVLKILES